MSLLLWRPREEAKKEEKGKKQDCSESFQTSFPSSRWVIDNTSNPSQKCNFSAAILPGQLWRSTDSYTFGRLLSFCKQLFVSTLRTKRRKWESAFEVIPTRRFTLRWLSGITKNWFQIKALVQAQVLEQVQVLVQAGPKVQDQVQDQRNNRSLLWNGFVIIVHMALNGLISRQVKAILCIRITSGPFQLQEGPHGQE